MESIAITGIGVVCSVAGDQQEYLTALRTSRPGLGPVERFSVEWIPTNVAGEVKAFDPVERIGDSSGRHTRADAFAVMAAREAVEQARLNIQEYAPDRIGVAMGTCQGNMAAIAHLMRDDRAHAGWCPWTSADAVAEWLGVEGERLLVSNACAAGTAAIAVAVERLLDHSVDAVVAGGTDELDFFSMSGFGALQSLDSQPCAPYSQSRGLTIGEGAGMFVLERGDDANARGANVLAWLVGYGLSSDGYHPTAPDPTGRGGALAMERALSSADLNPEDVDYVNGHGTGTPANDAMERKALHLLFKDRATSLPMSSIKAMVGHLLGAAGAVEAATCVLAIRNDLLPPTLNVPEDAKLDIDCVPNHARKATVRIAMSTNYAFGGSNAALLMAKRRITAPSRDKVQARRVLVTGIGSVGAPGIGIAAWHESLARGESFVTGVGKEQELPAGTCVATCPELSDHGIAPRDVWRKMDILSRVAVTSARSAWDDAMLKLPSAERDNVAVILATGFGSLDIAMRFERGARRGKEFASAKDFPHTSGCAAGGHICKVLSLHGPMFSVSNGAIAGASALAFAAQMIRQGHIEVALVTSVDELSPSTIALMPMMGYELSPSVLRPFDRYADGTSAGLAGITIVIESAEHAARRSAELDTELLGTAILGAGPGGVIDAARWTKLLQTVVERSGVGPDAVGYVAAGASGLPLYDQGELAALSKVFGGTATSVGAPKSYVGETLASSSLVNLVAGTLALKEGFLTPALNVGEPMDEGEVELLRQPRSTTPPDFAVANAIAPRSGIASIVIARSSLR